jgi:hypothetical protein
MVGRMDDLERLVNQVGDGGKCVIGVNWSVFAFISMAFYLLLMYCCMYM